MLLALTIRDLALIATGELRFDRGLNVLSGVTGGGKSLVITALKVLRGEKVSGELVRHGAEELRVDGEFRIGSGARWEPVRLRLQTLCGQLPEDGTLILTRIVDSRGRSSVRIDGRPATLRDLRDLGEHLIEIHGQGESRALMRPEAQAEAVDAFGGTAELRRTFAAALTAARQAQAQCTAATASERDRLARMEFLRFQLAELSAIGARAGELEELETEHQLLANLDRLRANLAAALDGLTEGEPSAGVLLARASRALLDAARIDRRLEAAAELVGEAETQVAEASRLVESRSADLDLDPARLSAVEDRLATLRRALARFGPSEADLLARETAAREELERFEADARSPEELEKASREALDALAVAARKLVRARQKVAAPFVASIERELADLGMADTRIELRFDTEIEATPRLLETATEHGPGPLDLAVRINPGEPFTLMRETASGGEAARIVLAIKKCLADQDRVPFVVFDEIDAEIGGRLGLEVGRKLRDVARDHQVLIVTHLPQVAAFADAHHKVEKSVRDGRTFSSLVRLDRARSEQELAAMAVGEGADSEALAEARRLVLRAQRASAGESEQA